MIAVIVLAAGALCLLPLAALAAIEHEREAQR